MGTLRAARGLRASLSAAANDVRSVALRDQLAAKYRDEVQGRPPAVRQAWLESQEAFTLFGVKRCRDMVRAIRDMHDFVSDGVVSMPWLDAWNLSAERSPCTCVEHQAGRRHSARMVMSRGRTAIGDGEPRARFTPPQAVAEEDLVDLMSPWAAAHPPHPGSPSAAVITRIREARATPMDGQW